jgi:hypothetical protein
MKKIEIEINLNEITDSIIVSNSGNKDETIMLAISTIVNTNKDLIGNDKCFFVKERDIRFFTDAFSLNRGPYAGFIGSYKIKNI